MRSVYIHIPFCKNKCWYCDFNSFSGKENLINDYIIALKKEIQSYSFNELKTVYFGGGTPSYIDANYIQEILGLLKHKNAEVTLEANPGTITKEKLESYITSGVNRLSIGLQATQNEILKDIGRIHTLEDFDNTYKLARDVGFTNISVDLMFGLPNQTLEDVKESLNYILKINPEHISCYSLILHKDTKKELPTDDEEREMYHYILKTLKNAGYVHYEISNFAKKGFESKHNLVYWNQEEYAGVGAGASSYVDSVRYTNERNIERYILENKREIEERQDMEAKLREYIILKLRLINGLNISEANKKFNVDIEKIFEKEIQKMCSYGLLEIMDGNIKLTEKGLDLANVVWEEFV